MLHTFWLRRFFMFAVLSLAFASTATAHTATCENPARLRFALIPQGGVQADLSQLQPLFDALRAALGKPVEAVVPASYGAVVEGLLAGAFDVARLGPASYIDARNQDARITPFASYAGKATPFNDGGAFYHSILVVRRDSRHATLESLRGGKLALVDPGSTSGALVPRHAVVRLLGTPLDEHFGRVVYAGSHEQSALRVLDGQVDAAFVGSTNLASLVAAGKADANTFRILWRSDPIPTDPFVYRGQLCPEFKDKIQAVFLGRGGAGNRAVLDRLEALRFVPISDRDYQIIRDLQ